MIEIGLHVKIIIGDQGSNNRSMFEKVLGRTLHSKFEKQIYVMYDLPHPADKKC